MLFIFMKLIKILFDQIYLHCFIVSSQFFDTIHSKTSYENNIGIF